MIEVTHLSKHFGALRAVDDVSFTVARGEVLGFLGPNGAGKSTTMKMVTGFMTPDAGRVVIGGDDLAARPLAVKRRIGYLPEGAPLYGDMTPRSFLEFIAEVRGLRGPDKRRRLATVIEQASLEEVLDRRIERLSKGFKRRVGLAQAILHDPEVLILDEPTDGLDPNQKHEVRELIRTMSADKVIVLSTHILEEVEGVCSRAIIIAKGRIVVDDSPAGLEARSKFHNALSLSLAPGDGVDGAAAALESLSEVAEVTVLDRSPRRLRLQVFPRNAGTLVGSVSDLARSRGWEVEELYVERGHLDDVFRALTTSVPRGEGS